MGFSGIKKKLQTAVKWALGVPIVALSVQSTIPLTKSAIDTYVHQAPIQIEFMEKYRIPLKAWESDLKNAETAAITSHIAEVLDREHTEKGFGISSVNLIPREWWKQDVLDWVMLSSNDDTGMYYNPFLKTVNISVASFKKDNLFPIMKRIKLEDIIQTNPEIIDLWQPRFELPQPRRIPLTKPRRLFASFNAQTYEDQTQGTTLEYYIPPTFTREDILDQIASFAGSAETLAESPEEMFRRIYTTGPEFKGGFNEVDMANLQLLERYGLLAPEYRVHITIAGWADKALKAPTKEEFGQATSTYVHYSNKFLKEFPNSLFISRIHLARAELLRKARRINPDKPDFYNQLIYDEATSGLKASFKEYNTQLVTLVYMEDALSSLGLEAEANNVKIANALYRTRHFGGDIHLSSRGVNDYLTRKGVLK